MSNNPLPPKTSIFWEHSHYTHDEATRVWESDGHLSSLNKEITSPETSSIHPPEKSMYWEGATSKPEIPELVAESKTLNLTPQNETDVPDVHFVPVRYAIDQLESPFGLPENWKTDASLEKRFEKSSYTLRQLRDGWLYTYNHLTRTLEEYQVQGTQFTHYIMGEKENPEQEKRGEAQPAKTYITCPQGSPLTLCFSTNRWSWTKFLQVIKQPGLFSAHGITVVIEESNTDTFPDIGPINSLAEVADIEVGAVNDKRFNDSFVATSADENPEHSDAEQIIKPVAVLDSITASLPQNEQAFVVALHDYIADGHDLAGRCVYFSTPYREYQEQKAPQWTLLQTIMRMCLFGDMEGLRFPPSVKTHEQRFGFYADIADYYESRQNKELITDNQTNNPYPAMFSPGSKESAQNTQTRIAESIQDKYNISPSTVGRYEQWAVNSKWRSSINWQSALGDMNLIASESKKLMSEALPGMLDLGTMLDSFNHHVLKTQCDLWSEQTQTELYTLHKSLIEAYTLVMTEESEQWLMNEIANPRTIIALNIAGFDREVYNSLTAQLKADDSEEKDLCARAGDWGTAQGLYDSFLDFMTNPDVNSTRILKDLAAGFNHLDQILVAASKALLSLTTKWMVSPVAWTTALVMPTLAKAPNANTNLFLAAMAERMALGSAVKIPENYAENIAAWQKKLNQTNAELAAARNKIVRFNNGDKSVSTTDFKKASKTNSRLSRSKAAQQAHPPEKIILPDDIKSANAKAYADIVQGKMDKLHEHFQNVGGLGFMALVFNLIAVNEVLSDVNVTGMMSEDDALKLAQAVASSASAWSGIRAGAAWGKIASNTDLHSYSVKALKTGIQNGSIKETSSTLKNTAYFTKWLGITAGLGILASGLELVRGLKALDGMYGREKQLQITQNFLVGASVFAGTVQLTGVVTGQLSIVAMFGAAVMTSLLILGIASILVGAALEKAKKDDYQKWLSRLPWGSDPSHRKWTDDTQNNTKLVKRELEKLDWLIQQPVISQVPIEKSVPNTNPSHSYDLEQKVITEIDVTINLPIAQVRDGITLTTNTQAEPERLMTGRWEKDEHTQRYNYKLTLPVNESEQPQGYAYQPANSAAQKSNYLLLKIGYNTNGDDGNTHNKHEYLCYHLAKDKTSYTAVKDKETLEKLAQIETNKTATIVALG